MKNFPCKYEFFPNYGILPALSNDNQALGKVTPALGMDILPALGDDVAVLGNDNLQPWATLF